MRKSTQNIFDPYFLSVNTGFPAKKNYFFAEIFFCTIFKNLIIILFNVLRSIQCLGSRLPYRQHRNHHGNFTPFKRDYFQTIAHLIELKKIEFIGIGFYMIQYRRFLFFHFVYSFFLRQLSVWVL